MFVRYSVLCMCWLFVVLFTGNLIHVRYSAICNGFVAIRPHIRHFIENDT